MPKVPIVRVGDVLIVTVQEDLGDRQALQLQMDLNAAVERHDSRGVLLDVTIVDTVDPFLGRLLGEVASSVRLLGAETVIVGIQPAVAIPLVELGLRLGGIRPALDADKGMRLLRRMVTAST